MSSGLWKTNIKAVVMVICSVATGILVAIHATNIRRQVDVIDSQINY